MPTWVVCVKQTVDTEAPQIPLRDGHLDEARVQFRLGEWEAAAISLAVTLKETHGGEVVAVAVGPPRVNEALRRSLALGADRAYHVVADSAPLADPILAAEALAGLLQGALSGAFDLVLTGEQAEDDLASVVPFWLAGRLGLPCVWNVQRWVGLANGQAEMWREREGGVAERVRVPLPAVVAVASGVAPPRYAPFKAVREAKTKPLATIPLPDLCAAPKAVWQEVAVFEPSSERDTTFLQGSPAEVAEALAGILREQLGGQP
ncbi:MAG: electron transfer flavoprotein subunit beta/FixA family protein [Dehalococcoidia bacterium]